jgi:hypothetical protein
MKQGVDLGDDELEFYRVLEEPVQELRAFFLARAHSGSFFSKLVPGQARLSPKARELCPKQELI